MITLNKIENKYIATYKNKTIIYSYSAYTALEAIIDLTEKLTGEGLIYMKGIG